MNFLGKYPLWTSRDEDSILPPWQAKPYQLVSWWNMEKFHADAFFEISKTLQMFAGTDVKDADVILEKDSKLIKTWLPSLHEGCLKIGLRLSAKHISRMLEELKQGKTRVKDWQTTVPELQHRIHDEMEDNLFMFIPPNRANCYNNPGLLGEETNNKFPSIQYDAVEAGNCYAAGRSTAVVFHLMRVMEVGVQEFGKKLGVTFPNDKNWQNILNEADKAIKQLDQKVQTTKELVATSANLYSVKLAWRNEVMHPKETYTLEEAEDLIRLVKIFMEQLAKVI